MDTVMGVVLLLFAGVFLVLLEDSWRKREDGSFRYRRISVYLVFVVVNVVGALALLTDLLG